MGWGDFGAALQTFGQGYTQQRQQALENAFRREQFEADEKHRRALEMIQQSQETRAGQESRFTQGRQREMDALTLAKNLPEQHRMRDDIFARTFAGTGSETYFQPDQTLPSTQFSGGGLGELLDAVVKTPQVPTPVPGYRRMVDMPEESKAALEGRRATQRQAEALQRYTAQREAEQGRNSRADQSIDARRDIADATNALNQARIGVLQSQVTGANQRGNDRLNTPDANTIVQARTNARRDAIAEAKELYDVANAAMSGFEPPINPVTNKPETFSEYVSRRTKELLSEQGILEPTSSRQSAAPAAPTTIKSITEIPNPRR